MTQEQFLQIYLNKDNISYTDAVQLVQDYIKELKNTDVIISNPYPLDLFERALNVTINYYSRKYEIERLISKMNEGKITIINKNGNI